MSEITVRIPLKENEISFNSYLETVAALFECWICVESDYKYELEENTAGNCH